MELFLLIIFCYISGSIPFGLILTKKFHGKDVRKIGSGNIGATNVLRTGNKYLAALTLLLDVLKGYVPILISQNYFSEFVQLACVITFLGHVFPIWLKFNGGKGVATYLGIITALSFQLFFLFIFTWIIVSLIFKYSSLSSIFSSLTVLVINFLRELFVDSGLVSDSAHVTDSKVLFIFFILIIFTHKKNISNLKNKIETKIKL